MRASHANGQRAVSACGQTQRRCAGMGNALACCTPWRHDFLHVARAFTLAPSHTMSFLQAAAPGARSRERIVCWIMSVLGLCGTGLVVTMIVSSSATSVLKDLPHVSDAAGSHVLPGWLQAAVMSTAKQAASFSRTRQDGQQAAQHCDGFTHVPPHAVMVGSS